jgi:hypothetical protein
MATDSYARRNRRKRAGGQACSSLLIVGLSLVALGWFLNSATGWVL